MGGSGKPDVGGVLFSVSPRTGRDDECLIEVRLGEEKDEVAGVKDACLRIPDGAEVEIDGASGTVRVLG